MRIDLGVQVTRLSKQRRSAVEYLVLLCWTAKFTNVVSPHFVPALCLLLCLLFPTLPVCVSSGEGAYCRDRHTQGEARDR